MPSVPLRPSAPVLSPDSLHALRDRVGDDALVRRDPLVAASRAPRRGSGSILVHRQASTRPGIGEAGALVPSGHKLTSVRPRAAPPVVRVG